MPSSERAVIPKCVAFEIEKLRIYAKFDFSTFVNWKYISDTFPLIDVKILRSYFCVAPFNYIQAVKNGYEIELEKGEEG